MEITTPITGLGNFMVIETTEGATKKVMFEKSTKFKSLSKPGGSVKAVSEMLELDFVIRAETPEDAREMLQSIWG